MKSKKIPVHFAKPIIYNNEEWLSDFVIGLKGVEPHGHLTMSGSIVQYLRDGTGKEIIKDGIIIADVVRVDK
ncbi:MAG: hypothetical protein V1889_02900 [archaeon]